MIKRRRFDITVLLRVYLAAILFLLSFFIIFAYRKNVLSILVDNDIVSFRISDEVAQKIQNDLGGEEFDIDNLNFIQKSIDSVVGDYTFSIFQMKNEQDYFLASHGMAPDEMSTKFSDVLEINFLDETVRVVLYPKFTGYSRLYILADAAVSLLISLFFYYLMLLEKKRCILRHIFQNIQQRMRWKLFHKLSMKLLIVNLLAGVFAFGMFFFMYENRYSFFEFIRATEISEQTNYDEIHQEITKKAKNLTFSKKNKKTAEKILDQYTSNYFYCYIYDNNGDYFAGNWNRVGSIERLFTRGTVYDVSAIYVPEYYMYSVNFSGETGQLMIYSYPLIPYVTPYLVVIVLIAVSMYLIPVMRFMNRKVFEIKRLQNDILVLASGDLSHDINPQGRDEIAQLGQDLNQMRLILSENIRSEEMSRKNNSELITSMSHDLRTPLTSLKAYLDILKYRKYKDKAQYEKCLDRCIRKAEDIKEMSDAMFEYSLVFEPDHRAQLENITLEELLPLLIDQMEQLEMNHYHIQYHSPDKTCRMEIDMQMMKRVFNNIFSNIMKYADQEQPIEIDVLCHEETMEMSFINHVRQDLDKVERNHIGLKSTAKMMSLMKGRLDITGEEQTFICKLTFPIL